MKACPKCGEMKPMDDFHRSKHAKSGRVSWCKICFKTRQRQSRSTRLQPDGTWLCRLCLVAKPAELFGRTAKGSVRLGCLDCADGAQHKTCGGCDRHLPATAFYRARGKLGGLQAECRECQWGARKESWARMPDDERKARRRESRRSYDARYPDAHRASRLKREFNLSLADHMDLYRRQGGRCQICQTPEQDLRKRLAVDHCHKTGKIRGLLCVHCNMGLGQLGDDLPSLRRAVDYLAAAEVPL